MTESQGRREEAINHVAQVQKIKVDAIVEQNKLVNMQQRLKQGESIVL